MNVDVGMCKILYTQCCMLYVVYSNISNIYCINMLRHVYSKILILKSVLQEKVVHYGDWWRKKKKRNQCTVIVYYIYSTMHVVYVLKCCSWIQIVRVQVYNTGSSVAMMYPQFSNICVLTSLTCIIQVLSSLTLNSQLSKAEVLWSTLSVTNSLSLNSCSELSLVS